jgi:hypothetical protein
MLTRPPIYQIGDWDTRPCRYEDRVTWWRRGSAWNDPRDCYNACHDELEKAVNQGLAEWGCIRQSGLAVCEMGYNTRQG